MKKNGSSIIWITLAFCIILGLAWQFFPLQDASSRLSQLPLKGIAYKGEDVPLNEFEKEFLKNVNVLKRIYRVNGNDYFITVIDGTSNRHVVHDPYYCFTGGGWRIVEEEELSIGNGHIGRLQLKKNNNELNALFWFSNGTSRFTSPLRYWVESTLRRITLGASGPEPILIVVQPFSNEDTDWTAFSEEMQPLFQL